MKLTKTLRGIGAVFAVIAGLGINSAFAEKITITDIAGRTVEVEKNPSRIVLGEGRMLYSLALLDRKNPFKRVVGWKDDLIKYDPDAYRKYLAVFPEAAKIANLGSPYSGEYSVETLITSNTQVVFLNLGNLLKAQESGILTKLEKAGIAVVFVDFRQRPTLNTVPSLQVMGRVLDQRDNADEFIDFYVKNMSSIYGTVEKIKDADKPVVFIERAAGYNPGKCCSTFGSANLGRLVDLSGGINWGTRLFPGFSGKVNPEALFVDNPDVIIGTGANWAEANPSTNAVLLGYEAKPEQVQERLAVLAGRRGWDELSAVKNGRFHTVYHQFYNSPYHFVAMQAFAKWSNPEQFKDLDPEATFKELHERFLPIDFSGVFWATLKQ
ncbi:ABC transporter substrate-binding protein [Pseudovibrio sp. Tun.PSC04-5.I4]|uniref:ABC transporter substrate-binding protein n=1 Tax=Pseudovibrio sp. Tun.PSC04-5.I4 TaxID=1798213 RepID=UPI00087E151D|nr:ABC transporter substrate-binding protein [Pseudovibrio sp. Tun.PSC04-5.I4]SDQ74207.1 iron complex transport system substrate-binding protein [Pseudovibrio sp. Tun.PSC04-5.I4]